LFYRHRGPIAAASDDFDDDFDDADKAEAADDEAEVADDEAEVAGIGAPGETGGSRTPATD
jgi:hypothetical protein